MGEPTEGLAAEIQRLMDARGMGTAGTAWAVGMHRTAFYKLLAGERPNLSADVLFKLADALGVDANHFRPFVTSRLANDPGQAEDVAAPEAPPELPRGKRK